MTTKLTYFDFDGSRGLECRLALHLAEIEFEDERVDRAGFLAMKPTLPYGSLPVLTVDGRRLTQCTAILNHIGRSSGLQPEDSWRQAVHESLMLSVEDLRNKVPAGRGMTDEDKKTARQDFAAGWLMTWAQAVSDEIVGPFIEGPDLCVADLKLYTILRGFMNGTYDHIPTTCFQGHPKLTALYATVDSHPAVQDYFASR